MKESATSTVQASGLFHRMFGVGAHAGNSLPVRKLMVAVLLLVVATFLGVFAVAQAQAADGTMTGVTLASGSPGTLAVSWKAPSPAPTDYRVRWAPVGSDYLSWNGTNETDRGNAYPAGDVTSLTLSGLSEGTEFKVQARARYHKGEHKDSPWSGPWAEASALVMSESPDVPSAPAAPNLAGTVLTPEGHVMLLWQNPSDDSIIGYQVLRGPDADSLVVIEQDTGSGGTSYTDNDTPGVTVAPTSLTVGEGDMGTYTVKLITLPTGNVMVDISSNNTDVTVSPSSLTFTAGNWNSTQTVTVSAGQDADAADDMATLTHNPSGADYDSVSNASLTVTVTDNDTRGVTVSPTSLTVNEGGTGTYTVVLDTQPTSSVTVTVNDPTNTDVTADPASLTFSTSNWATAQTVTVSAAEDDDSTRDTATVTHTFAGGDYASFAASNVAVTVTDNDTPGVMVLPTSLTIDEGNTDTYTVELNTQPSGDMMVAISSNNTDVTVSSSPLTFTTTNWNSAQTVTVTAGQDADAADDKATLTHNPSGADYGSVSNAILMVTVTDDETAGVTVTPTSLTVNEGGTNTYTIVLDTEPTDTVTVAISSNNTDVTVSASPLTVWDTAVTVTVSAAEDADSTHDTATVTHTVTGGDYNFVINVIVTVTDNDTPGVTVTPLSLTIGEGSTGTYAVVLNTQPSGNVMVAIRSNNTDVTVPSSTLTFTMTDWNTEQTVTVTAGQDADAANDMATLTHNPSGGGYNSVSNAILMVTVTDDDTAGLVLSATTLGVDEAGQNTYTVKLQTQPTTTVTVTVSSGDTGAATVSGPTLRFTTSNWDTEQTVTVRGVNDGDSDDETVTVTHTASGGEYAGVTASVTVTVDDDDTRGITFTPAARTIREGATGTYDVKLNTAPTADVTVAISSDNPDVTVNKSSLTFTTVNYTTNQRVTVTAAEDADAADGTANLNAPPQRRRLQRRRSQGLHGHRYRRRHCRPGALGHDAGGG